MLDGIAAQIWDMKYRLKGPEGFPIDRTLEDSWMRVANALSVTEEDPAFWSKEFYSVLEDFKFLPAGRIIAGAGSDRRVTLFNCFVMGTIPDDMGGIFENLKEGTGQKVKTTDTVTFKFVAELTTEVNPFGRVFADSINPPFKISIAELTKVLPGAAEGLMLMKKGGHALLHIPPSQA